MLATWLLEIYLSKCNELEDVVASESVSHDVEDLKTEQTFVEKELREFLDTYKVFNLSKEKLNFYNSLTARIQTNLDPKTVYELIESHGRTDVYLHYATIVGDLERVIEHWVLEEEWTKAIDVLNRQVSLLQI